MFRRQKRKQKVKQIRRLKFANKMEPDLATLFNAKKERYRQRRSTAIWRPVINARPDDSIVTFDC